MREPPPVVLKVCALLVVSAEFPEYFCFILVGLLLFLAALLAILGNTTVPGKRGIRSITKLGWLSGIVAVFGLAVATISINQTHKKENEAVQQREAAIQITTEANKKIGTLGKELGQTVNALAEANQLTEKLKRSLGAATEETAKSNARMVVIEKYLQEATTELSQSQRLTRSLKRDLAYMRTQMLAYRTFLQDLRNHADRSRETVMAQFVTLGPGKGWGSPNYVYSGSLLKLLGQCDTLLVGTHEREEKVSVDTGRATELAISGPPGFKQRLFLLNKSIDECRFKVFVESSPRIRSIKWSWIEERIEQIE